MTHANLANIRTRMGAAPGGRWRAQIPQVRGNQR
jgi:hypothetical protein